MGVEAIALPAIDSGMSINRRYPVLIKTSDYDRIADAIAYVSDTVDLSSSSRLHDHFVHLKAVTPGEYKTKGKGLQIDFGIHSTPFGTVFLAVTGRGVCRAAFLDADETDDQLTDLRRIWPLASFTKNDSATQGVIDAMFEGPTTLEQPLSLHVTGTNFQIAVWRALLRISSGAVVSYSQIAASVGRPRASRAVGNAIGANPIAFLIPCHRVIRQSGALGGYRWGQSRKHMIQAWERAQLESNTP
jgi:AraC family transcriptional regulator of adaptative response/methylated-DNA-[protein]-cysteine methyltransferase